MTQTRGFDAHRDGAARTERERSEAVAGLRDSSAVVALMRAGNDLAAALDCGGYSEPAIEQLVRAWESALFVAASDLARQLDAGPEGRA